MPHFSEIRDIPAMSAEEIKGSIAKLNESQKKVLRSNALNVFVQGDSLTVEPVRDTGDIWITILRNGVIHWLRMGPRGRILDRKLKTAEA